MLKRDKVVRLSEGILSRICKTLDSATTREREEREKERERDNK